MLVLIGRVRVDSLPIASLFRLYLDLFTAGETPLGCFIFCTAAAEAVAQTDPMAAAQLIQATLHSLALRSRAGQSRATLNRMVKGAVDMICR